MTDISKQMQMERMRKLALKVRAWTGLVFVAFFFFLIALIGLGPLVKEFRPAPPGLSTGPDGKGLVAPFAEDAAPSAAQAGASAVPAKDLGDSHRPYLQVSGWLEEKISQLMNTDAPSFEQHKKETSVFLDQSAASEYTAFMANSKIIETLQANDLQVRAHVEERPLLLNKGSVDGRYRWLFEMPVMLTFLPRSTNTYKGSSPASQSVIISVQVGRVGTDVNDDELVIETFSVRQKPGIK
ncbi:MAG: DotI/IcmL family type IV secretion protein [Proteobacteria bacterium]|nr:DotI/IcmL family type IV secretion protein [Pseudomonadota bacterium]